MIGENLRKGGIEKKYQKRDTEQDLLQHWEEQPI